MNDHTVFKFNLFFDGDFKPEDRQERYVVATKVLLIVPTTKAKRATTAVVHV